MGGEETRDVRRLEWMSDTEISLRTKLVGTWKTGKAGEDEENNIGQGKQGDREERSRTVCRPL
jgi:hypothetical protein